MTVFPHCRFIAPAAALALAVVLSGCSDSTGPGSAAGGAQFSKQITFEELQQQLGDGNAMRVEVEILDVSAGPPYVVRELEVEKSEDLADREEIKSRVVNVVLDATCQGALELEVEGVMVEFSETATRFEDDDSGELSCSEFLDIIQAEIATLRFPEIQAKREPQFENGLPAPQAPDDPVFAATRIEVEDHDDRVEFEVNIDSRHLVDCSEVDGAPAGCLGALRLFGADLVLQEGVSEIEQKSEDAEGSTEFEGLVSSVAIDENNPDLGSVTLQDGTVIRVVEGTKVEGSDDDADDDGDKLRSLQEVDAAVGAGTPVEAEGKGVVESSDGTLVITAMKVEFETEDRGDSGGDSD